MLQSTNVQPAPIHHQPVLLCAKLVKAKKNKSLDCLQMLDKESKKLFNSNKMQCRPCQHSSGAKYDSHKGYHDEIDREMEHHLNCIIDKYLLRIYRDSKRSINLDNVRIQIKKILHI